MYNSSKFQLDACTKPFLQIRTVTKLMLKGYGTFYKVIIVQLS